MLAPPLSWMRCPSFTIHVIYLSIQGNVRDLVGKDMCITVQYYGIGLEVQKASEEKRNKDPLIHLFPSLSLVQPLPV
jgi:hypothetical protein